MAEQERVVVKHTVASGDPTRAVDLLAVLTTLSKSALKDAMNKGAVWLTRRGQRKRLRRATAELSPGDRLELFYDRALFAAIVTPPRLIADLRRYSVWHKPAGVLAEGTDYGDHAAMERLVAAQFQPERAVFIVHRLDREAQGLMLVAHDKDAAARLSRLFSEGQRVEKVYRVQVRGQVTAAGRVELPLDGKGAVTEYSPAHYDAELDVTSLSVRIHTGRLHQIRRHLEAVGHPVMGDPRYGRGNKNREGLRLAAVRIAFRDPFSGEARAFELSGEVLGWQERASARDS